jgi:LmbE family N-acetylglucosaminyl deacetylase
MTAFRPRAPLAFISPHLDDVALSCGHAVSAVPGAHVLTVFTAAPPVTNAGGSNERKTGQAFAPHALRMRRDEDAVALKVLEAHPHWLGLHELEYSGPNQDQELIIGAVRSVITEIGAQSVVAPLGFHHPDHLAVSNACLELAKSSTLDWYLYLDMPYGQVYEEEKEGRLQALSATVDLVALDPLIPSGPAKRMAVELYASQLNGLRQYDLFDASLSDPEQYWRLPRRERFPMRDAAR